MASGLRDTASRLVSSVRRLPPGGILALTAGFLLMLSNGGLLTFGNLITYVTSYLHVRLGEDVGYGDVVWVETALAIAEGITLLPGSVLYRKYGPQATIAIGSIITTSSIALTYFTVQMSLVWVTVTYGMVNGFGIGLMYAVPMLVGYKWFPDNKGIVSGITFGGYGMAGIVFNPLHTMFINPSVTITDMNGFFHSEALLNRVPLVFLLQAGICCALQIIGILFIRDPQQPNVSSSENNSQEVGQHAVTDTADVKRVDAKKACSDRYGSSPVPPKAKRPFKNGVSSRKILKDALRTAKTYQLLLGFFSNNCVMAVIYPLWKVFGQTFITDDQFLLLVGSGISVFSVLGRVTLSFLCDFLGYKRVMMLLSGFVCALTSTLPLTPLGGKFVFLAHIWVLFFCLSGNNPVVMTGTAETFGEEGAGPVYGLVFMSGALASTIMSLLCSLLLAKFGFWVLFLLAGGVAFCGLIATCTIRSPDSVQGPE